MNDNDSTVPGPQAVFQYGPHYVTLFSTADLRRMEQEAEHGRFLHRGGIVHCSDIRRELEKRGGR